MSYYTFLWIVGLIVIISIFVSIGRLYYFAGDKKDKIAKTFSIFYSPSIFTLIISLRTLAVSDFSKSNKPIEFVLQHLYFGFAISIMLNLLNLILLESNSSKSYRKHLLFYMSLLFNALSFSLWLILAYMLFDII